MRWTGGAISLLTGEDWMRENPSTGDRERWVYRRQKTCDSINANRNLLLFRSTMAGFFELQQDSGTGYFSGFRSGCTSNLIPADGVLNALDYTRTCTCSYPNQTSLAMVYMGDDSNIEAWTRLDALPPDPMAFGLNYGAPGRRVDQAGLVWHDQAGNYRRHPSAMDGGQAGVPAWVVASGREGEGELVIDNVLDGSYRMRLFFAEPAATTVAGERIFDVLINGETELYGFDIVRAAGGPLKGVMKEFRVDTVENTISIELRTRGESGLEPVLSGVELHKERISTTDEISWN